ncbi:HAD-IA family hydrolase [Aestuariirhabdus sp. Z084]|uniref:HAD-IA family hydrolase n=1 Tax=Aestuariirhabdus haliotis TaxID=2918751 RepID=UPI00201B4041|nr:HAD-IA family hydrolase [Aestuariirhabdus haliotis]MCL6414795.1 HAD-IA family hydrolase [Aestuariirhabdus haliotis]MCL6418727.1 HAD-IA family hydrolase [Aestuariirhabdus haliotis]
MNKRYELVIFDWDGTLVDSAERISHCLSLAASDVGLAVLEHDQYKDIIGLGLPEAFRKLYPEVECTDTLERMRDRYSHHFLGQEHAPSDFYERVEVGLEQIWRSTLKSAVATGKSRRGLDRVLNVYGWQNMFDITRCADETRSKPHPQMLEEILEETGIAPENAVMVGDTEYDMEMAHRAGVDRIAMGYGAHDISRLSPFSPVLEAHHFDEVVTFLSPQ